MNYYFIGYTFIDNYYYFLTIIFNPQIDSIIIDNIEYPYKKIKDIIIIKTPYFYYEGTIKNNIFQGISTLIYNKQLISNGIFKTYICQKNTFLKISKFPSPWKFLASDILQISPPIYSSNTSSSPLINLSILSFNICSSFIWTGNDGMHKVVDIIEELNPDIILLQEINVKQFNQLVKLINKKNKYYSNYTIGLLSKYKIKKVFDRIPISPVYGAEISLNKNTNILVFNSHLDSDFSNIAKKSKDVQLPHLIYGLYSSLYNKNLSLPSILVGDHNNTSHLDEPNKPWAVSRKLEKDGWIDTYRFINPEINKIKDITYPNCDTPKKIKINEIGDTCEYKIKDRVRIDYIYSRNGKNITLLPVESSVINKYDSLQFPSDHNAVFTRFLVFKK